MITCQPWDVQLHQVQGTCGLASCFFSKGLECGLPATCSIRLLVCVFGGGVRLLVHQGAGVWVG